MRSQTAGVQALMFLCASALPQSALARDGSVGIDCFPTAQTRQKIAQHHLLEPFEALKNARREEQGEAISERLCTNGESYFYEIGLLRHDGRTLKVHVDAVSGKAHLIHVERQAP